MSIHRSWKRRGALAFRPLRRFFYRCDVRGGATAQRGRSSADTLRRSGTQADSHLHLYGVGYADALHDGLRERRRSEDQGGAGAVFAARTSPSRRPCRNWRRIATCASNILPLEIHRLGEIDTAKIQPHGLLYLAG